MMLSQGDVDDLNRELIQFVICEAVFKGVFTHRTYYLQLVFRHC